MKELKSIFSKWGLVLLLGILAILMGIFMLANPGMTFHTLSTIFIVNFLTFGILTAAKAVLFREKNGSKWILQLIGGLAVIFLAVYIAAQPLAPETLLLTFFAVGYIMSGVSMIFYSVFTVRRLFPRWWLLLIFGVITVLAGCGLLSDAITGVIAIVTLAGVGMLSQGLNLIHRAIFMSKVNTAMKEVL